MIRKLVDFSLENRILVLAAAMLLLAWGAISFHQLPVEAYPDVANNYVEIITQWPGNGIPHVVHLRSFSLFGLSDLKLIFDDEEENAWNRERVLEYINQLRARGHMIEQAAIEGAALRLRTIMMTMLVATLGLLPAALSHGIGFDSQRPFAIVIVGGFVGAMVLSIFLLPTLYVWVARDTDRLPTPEAEFVEDN